MPIKQNIEKIKKEIPSDVVIVAATKTRTAEEINEAIAAGIKEIGENYVQEAEKKFIELKGKVKFHLIGHLQKNKVKKAVEIFDMIETVDSLKIANELNKNTNKIIPILIEVNIANEKNKAGALPEEVIQLIQEISKLNKIKVKGLMTMGPLLRNQEDYRPYFKKMKLLFEQIKKLNIPNVEMEYLSMGMSDSYEIAIEEGANMVRIGNKIFGDRKN